MVISRIDYCLTNRFHVAVRLFSNRSQMTSKCGKNKKVAHEAIAECVTDVRKLQCVRKLQSFQNAAARLLANTVRYLHITPVMIDLHSKIWLLVEFRIIFKIILMTFKALHGLAPPYLTNMLSYKAHLR